MDHPSYLSFVSQISPYFGTVSLNSCTAPVNTGVSFIGTVVINEMRIAQMEGY
jgi:hypothetical protein